MSAEQDLQALLANDAGVRAALGVLTVSAAGKQIAADRIEQGTPRPFVIHVKGDTERFESLDNVIHAEKVSFALQAWADTRASAEALADACEAAILATGNAVVARSTGQDEELDLEAALISIEWWT